MRQPQAVEQGAERCWLLPRRAASEENDRLLATGKPGCPKAMKSTVSPTPRSAQVFCGWTTRRVPVALRIKSREWRPLLHILARRCNRIGLQRRPRLSKRNEASCPKANTEHSSGPPLGDLSCAFGRHAVTLVAIVNNQIMCNNKMHQCICWNAFLMVRRGL